MHRILLAALLLNASIVFADDPVDFGTQIAPLLTRNCSACHNAKKPEGGLVLESFTTLMKGGDSGAAVVAGMADKSSLVERIIATDDTAMPPADNAVGAKRLTEAEVALVKAWIAAGAPAPKASTTAAMVFRDITGSIKPIYASDVAPDGSYVAYGVGNVVALATNPFGTAAPKIDYLIDPELKLPDGKPIQATHVDLVQSIAFSPDSQRLAIGGYRSVKIWKRVTEFAPLAAPVPPGSRLLATDMAGSRAAFATPEHSIVLVNADSLQPTVTLKGHTDRVTAVTFAFNSNMIFSSDATGRVLRWDVPAEGVTEMVFAEATPNPAIVLVSAAAKDVRGMASANPQSLILLKQDNKIAGMQMAAAVDPAAPPTFTALPAFDRFADVHSVAVSKPTDTAMYMIVANNGVSEQVKPDSAETTLRFEQGAPVATLAVSHDGTRISIAGTTGPAKLWNLADGKLLSTLQRDYEHVRALQVAERNVARQKAFVDTLAARVPELKKEAEKEVEARTKVEEARKKAVEAVAAKVKDVETAQAAVTTTQAAMEETRKAIEELNKKMQALTAELDTKQKAVMEADKKKKDADAEVAKHDQALATATEGVERANKLIPQQEMLVAAETGILTTAQQALDGLKNTPEPAVTAVAFDADNASVVTLSGTSLNVYEVASGKPLARLQAPPTAIQTLLVSSSRRLLGGDGNAWHAWNLGLPWTLERSLGSPFATDPAVAIFSDRITALDFSPDGQLLAVGSGAPSRFGDVKLIQVSTGAVARDLGEAHSDTVLGLEFSPDGRYLATCGADKLCRLFQLDNGQLLRSFEGHTHHVLGVAWQSNGQTFATASADNSVKTWNVATGERKQSIGGYSKEVTAIEFVGQTDQVATSSVDGQARLQNASNAQQVRAFGGANTALYTVSVSDDGQYIVAGGQSGQLLIWKTADAALVRKIPDDPK